MSENSVDVLNLFENNKLVKICAPMVRYSKLQFRSLVKEYGCDLCFTPMILADSFCKSEKARQNEFTTNELDNPLIAQFAANTVHDFVGASHLVAPYCQGVDLNCGCPQRWAKQIGVGCCMLEKPELIADIVKTCKNQMPQKFTVSVKTRILKDLKKTVKICKQLEHAGISFLSIHARTPTENTGNVNLEALKLIKENIQCPLIANGGIKSLEECYEMQKKTNCNGVMIANAILTNPAIFSGQLITTLDCVQKWIDICYNSTLTIDKDKFINDIKTISERPQNLTFQCFHHHLVFMLEKMLPRRKRREFNSFQTFKQVLDFLNSEFDIKPSLFSYEKFSKNRVLIVDYTNRHSVYQKMKFDDQNLHNDSYNYESNPGKYFNSKTNNISDDFDECDSVNLDRLFIQE